MPKPKILVHADYYTPGYKGGGVITTLVNIVEWLGDEFDFYVLTRDRDLGDTTPYPGTIYGTWTDVGKAKVRYLAPHELKLGAWKAILNELDYDLLYLNSFFSTLSVQTMFLRWRKQLPDKPVLLAPRGEFYPGAITLKGRKKQLYIRLVRMAGIYQNIIWQASTTEERHAIMRVFKSAFGNITTAVDLLPNIENPPELMPPSNQFRTKLVFISRISPKKHLDYALELLTNLQDPIRFDIYGPLEDKAYWAKCEAIMQRLPKNIHVEYRGELHPSEIAATFSRYHLFLFPTRGENFGHVIWESLYAGCPVLLSDQTPWQDLHKKGIGWVLPLNQPELFIEALNEVTRFSAGDHQRRAEAAQDYAVDVARDMKAIDANRQMFLRALESVAWKADEMLETR